MTMMVRQTWRRSSNGDGRDGRLCGQGAIQSGITADCIGCFIIYFISAVVAVDSSHMTLSSSAS